VEDPEPADEAAWDRRLRALPPAQRRAVVLRHVVGLDYDEIAEATGRPPATVRSDVHRGLERLRATLEGES
jgi:RNA polymerase sigma-70 factor (ECF subfamily)